MTGLFASLFMFLFGAAAVFVIFFTTDVVKFFKRRRARRLDLKTNATFASRHYGHEYVECAEPHSSDYFKDPHCQRCGAPAALPSAGVIHTFAAAVDEMPKAGGEFRIVPGVNMPDVPSSRVQEQSVPSDTGGVNPLIAGWIGYEIGRNSGAPAAEAPEGATDPRDYAADPPAPAPDSDPAPEPAEAPAAVEQQSEPSSSESSTSSFDSEPTSSFDSEPSASE